MIAKDLILIFREMPLADATEVSHVLLLLAPVADRGIFSRQVFEVYATQGSLRCGTLPEFSITNPKNCAKNTITGCRGLTTARTYAKSVAVSASVGGERQRFRSSPFHKVVFPYFGYGGVQSPCCNLK